MGFASKMPDGLRAQHNPPNPALVDFRRMHGAKKGYLLAHAASYWAASLPNMMRHGAYPYRAGLHAQAVLVRLAYTRRES